MPALNSLNFNEDSAPQVDWDAPEAGKSPPPILPGIYTFQFKMPESHDDWFDEQLVPKNLNDRNGPKQGYLVIMYAPIAQLVHSNDHGFPDRAAAGRPMVDPSNNEPLTPQLTRQRASFYKHPKMTISAAGDLLRSLQVRLDGDILSQIEGVLAQLDGKAHFQAEVKWHAYFKDTETTISTHPRKKKGDIQWPKDVKGQWEMMVSNPATGEKAFGYAEITRFYLPQGAGQ